MTDQEVKDRLEILELLSRYSWALSDKDWDAWQAVFAAGATVDYSTAGGPVGSPAEAALAFAGMLSMFDVAMSQVSNVVITFEAPDRATCRSMYRMVMRIPGASPDDAGTYMEAQGAYEDLLTYTADGWRIARRYEHLSYVRA